MPKPRRNKVVSVLLNEEEYEILASYANFKDLSLSEVLRDYVKHLPNYSDSIFQKGF